MKKAKKADSDVGLFILALASPSAPSLRSGNDGPSSSWRGRAGGDWPCRNTPRARGCRVLFQEIEPDPLPDVPLGIGVEDRMDGARGAAIDVHRVDDDADRKGRPLLAHGGDAGYMGEIGIMERMQGRIHIALARRMDARRDG